MVFQTLRRHLHRRFPDFWQPAQELHSDQHNAGSPLLGLGSTVTPHEYSKLLWMCIVINAFMVVASTVIGGYMVEMAQAKSASGRLTAVRQFVQQGCSIINGPSAGYLASIAFTWTALACGGVMFLLVPATILFLHEQRKRIDSRELLENAGKQLVNIGTAKTMWAAVGLMALFYIAPGFSTAIFYKTAERTAHEHAGTGFSAAHCRAFAGW